MQTIKEDKMGCHTWIYKKISKVPKDKIKELCDRIISSIDSYWIVTENPHVYAEEMKNYYKEEYDEDWDISEILKDRTKTIEEYRSWQERLKSYSSKEYLKYLKRYKSTAEYRKYNGEYYILYECDRFRFSHYTSRKFTDSEKLIKYFEKREFSGCYIGDISGKSKKLIDTIHDILDSGDTFIEFG